MKALITGILGFIGSNLAEKLVNNGDEVYGLVRRVASRNFDVLGETVKDVTMHPPVMP
jgi:nucleoside-diphosphate-sugar epimerase